MTLCILVRFFFFFKQKTAYEMRISDWSSDVCSSDLDAHDYRYFPDPDLLPLELGDAFLEECQRSLPELPDAKRSRYESGLGLSSYNAAEIGRASCRGRVCTYV